MIDFIENIFHVKFTLWSVISGLYLFIFFYFWFILKFRRNLSRRKSLKSAFEIITSAYKDGLIEDSDDVLIIYEVRIHRIYEYYTFVEFLEQYLVYIQSQNEMDIDLRKSIRKDIRRIIKADQADKPFEGVEVFEKRILLAINECAKKNEPQAIRHMLEELSIAIQNNQKRLRNAINTNKWTVPISIIGVILTIATWMLGSSISNNDIEKINNATKKAIIEAQLHTDIIRDSIDIESNDLIVK